MGSKLKRFGTLKIGRRAFSLIELMIVVAIIGILATVAIPNFQRFQGKARQSSAKSLLSGYYTAQKATYSEYNIYPGNFSGAGYKPDGEIPYRVTASNNSVASTVSGYASGCTTSASTATCPAGYMTWTEGPSAAAPGGSCTTGVTGTVGGVGTFTACAGANIGASVTDTWRINDAKTLSNTTEGLP
jgi:type IV pilus assembly protein PilA